MMLLDHCSLRSWLKDKAAAHHKAMHNGASLVYQKMVILRELSPLSEVCDQASDDAHGVGFLDQNSPHEWELDTPIGCDGRLC